VPPVNENKKRAGTVKVNEQASNQDPQPKQSVQRQKKHTEKLIQKEK
jgi:hypothetical protein